MTLLGSVLRDEPGATAIECGLIAAGIVSRQQRSPQPFCFSVTTGASSIFRNLREQILAWRLTGP
jgi:hypothetical protein